jgi:hypothetical protein
MSNVKVFLPETQARMVEHQRALKAAGMKRAAVVAPGNIAKMQMKRTA